MFKNQLSRIFVQIGFATSRIAQIIIDLTIHFATEHLILYLVNKFHLLGMAQQLVELAVAAVVRFIS